VSAGTLWLLGGLVGLIAEVVMPGVFLLWLGLAALGTGLAARAGLASFHWQVTVFVLLAPVSMGIGLWLRRRRTPVLNTSGSGLTGRAATVLAFEGGEGRVRLGDSDWSARLEAGGTAAPGARVWVVGVAGTVLLVAAETVAPEPVRG
jgi:membrane protein implicated in regulation of membrane protease activity